MNLFPQTQWGFQTSGTIQNLNSVSFFDTSYGVAVGDSGKILFTSNGGYNWSVRFGERYMDSNDVVYADSQSVFAAGYQVCMDGECGMVYRSTDRGLNWQTKPQPVSRINALTFNSTTNGLGVGHAYSYWDQRGWAYNFRFKNNDSIWKSFMVMCNDTSTDEVMTDVSYPDTNFCVAITQQGNIYRLMRDTLTDRDKIFGNSYWRLLGNFPYELNSIHFVDTTIGTIVGSSGNIWKTTDGGLNWESQISGTSQNLNSVFFLNSAEGYIAGDGGTILHTINGGSTWSIEISGTIQNLRKIYFIDSKHGWVVGGNGLILKRAKFKNLVLPQTEIKFGKIIERESRTDSIVLMNTGSDSMTISKIQSDNSEFVSTQSNLILLPGQVMTVNISFSPLSPGSKSGHIIFTHNAPSSPDTVFVEGMALDYDTMVVTVNPKWNLVSNPRLADNDSTHILFPSAISKTYKYDQTLGYQESPRIENGIGYWIKFNSYEEFNIPGVVNTIDTIEVNEGWNLIGSISKPIATSSIIQVPTNIVDSEYFGFEDGYKITDVIIPGKAYWVKVNMNGKLILISP